MVQTDGSSGFDITCERETDGRWIAEVGGLPGALAYGGSRQGSVTRVRELALRILADRIANQERVPEFVERLFRTP